MRKLSSPATRERKGTHCEAMGEVRGTRSKCPHLSRVTSCHGPLSSPASQEKTNRESPMHTSDTIIAAARGWIGTPYQHQASLKHVGCDCLGLIRGVWRDVYGVEPEEMPAYSPDWAEAGGVEALADAGRRHLLEVPCADYLPGDVLLFRWKPHLPAKHAGIATTATTMIHAQDGARVSEIALTPWWKNRLVFAFRFPGVQD
jgi:NlpC/P60 family putative phage cell wall peptidase